MFKKPGYPKWTIIPVHQFSYACMLLKAEGRGKKLQLLTHYYNGTRTGMLPGGGWLKWRRWRLAKSSCCRKRDVDDSTDGVAPLKAVKRLISMSCKIGKEGKRKKLQLLCPSTQKAQLIYLFMRSQVTVVSWSKMLSNEIWNGLEVSSAEYIKTITDRIIIIRIRSLPCNYNNIINYF